MNTPIQPIIERHLLDRRIALRAGDKMPKTNKPQGEGTKLKTRSKRKK